MVFSLLCLSTLYYFAHETMKKWPSKVGYITKNAEFFSTALTVQTAPTAQISNYYVSWNSSPRNLYTILWREIYFWTFMCFPRSRKNDKVHALIFLMGYSKCTNCHIPIFENRFLINFSQQSRESWICNWMILCFFG